MTLMQLGQYLAENELTVAEFARALGVSPEAVRLYLVGKRRPRAGVIDRIREVTGAKVQAGDFFGDVEEESAA